MEIVHEENNCATKCDWNHWRCCRWSNYGRVRNGYNFTFPRTPSNNPLEEADWPRLSVDQDFKLVAPQSINKVSGLINDCKCTLNKFSISANNIISRLRLLLCLSGWLRDDGADCGENC